MRQALWAFALACGLGSGAAAAAESVDLELVLLADASGSIDDAEVRFQRQGYAAAITHPEILRAIAQGYDQRIAVTYVEWGTVGSQDVVVPWTILDGPASAAAFAQALLAAPRRAFGRNAMGDALAFGQAQIEANGIEGYRKVIDLSADSANSWGGRSIAEARANVLFAEIVINGLAILCRSCSGRPVRYDLEAAFAERIIGGPGSFVISATGDEQFAEAVRRKLVLEIAGAVPDLRLARD
ncbi:MAG TPA: DUF1194 domain-containing protein [Geminicoccaceae bacterium]|nr:DUF1194 domain-containing protein [Geminicoccaceae bacterium]